MKKLLAIFVSLVLLSVVVYAHAGRTDASGGHYDRSTGVYHYHHGYSAHQHTDMDGDGILDCPYNFDDQTGSSSGSSSKDTIYSIDSSEEVPFIPKWVYWVMGILAFLAVVMCLIAKSESNKFKRSQIQHKQDIKTKQQQIHQNFARFEQNLIDAHGENYLYILAGAIDGDTVAEDGLPMRLGHSNCKWGEKYTFFISSNIDRGEVKYHKANCRYRGFYEVNAYTIYNKYRFTPCKLCNPELPNLDWFIRYQNIKKFIETYRESP